MSLQPYICDCGVSVDGRDAFKAHLAEKHPEVKEVWYFDKPETWGHGPNQKTVRPEDRKCRTFEFITPERNIANEVTGVLCTIQDGKFVKMANSFLKSEQGLQAVDYPLTRVFENGDVKDLKKK